MGISIAVLMATFAIQADTKYVFQMPVGGIKSSDSVVVPPDVPDVPDVPNVPDVPVYDQNGFDQNGIHKDTGTIYNPEGYDKSGYDSDGYDSNWRDVNNVAKQECPSFNGPYFYGNTTTNPVGADYYAKTVVIKTKWEEKTTKTIYWNDVVVGSGNGLILHYSPYTKVYAPTSFVKDGFLYFFKDIRSDWHTGTTNQALHYSYSVCREKVVS